MRYNLKYIAIDMLEDCYEQSSESYDGVKLKHKNALNTGKKWCNTVKEE